MARKERGLKEKNERKELILNAALHLIQSHGVTALTMRKLADTIEFSPCVVYESFPNKEAIILELFSKVCRELLVKMRSVPVTEDTESYFLELIEKDIHFMMQKPFRVELFTIVSTTLSPQEFPPAMQEVIALIGASLNKLNFENLKTDEQLKDAQDVLRTFLSGVLNLIISQESTHGLTRCKYILKNGLITLLNGWKSIQY